MMPQLDDVERATLDLIQHVIDKRGDVDWLTDLDRKRLCGLLDSGIRNRVTLEAIVEIIDAKITDKIVSKFLREQDS